MKFEKNLYTFKRKANWIKPLFSSFLLLFFMFNPMQADAFNEACEGVEFTIELNLVRGVCESGEKGIVNVKVTDGTNQEYGYDWADNLGNSGFDVLSGDDFDILSLPANTNFCVTIERQETEGGCIQQACIEVPAVSTLSCAIELTNDFGCDGEATGQLTATITGGQGFYVYQWSSEVTACSEGATTDVSGEDGAVISNLAPGRYSLTVTDATGCSSNRRVCDIEVCAPVQLSVELEATQPDCDGQGINGSISSNVMGGVGNYSYDWSGPNGFSSDKSILNALSPGDYSLLLTDERGCSFMTSVTLETPICEEPPLPECDCDETPDGQQLFSVFVTHSAKGKKKKGGSTTTGKTAEHKVRFLNSFYDEASNTTTFSYKVSNCGDPAISHYAFGSNGRNYLDCFAPNHIVSTEGPAPGWKKRDNAGISGLKFDQGIGGSCDSGDNSREVSFTLSGNVGTTTSGFYFGIKAGTGNNQVEIPGPDCANIQERLIAEETFSATTMGQVNEKEQTRNVQSDVSDDMNNLGTTTVHPTAKVYPNPFINQVNVVIDQASQTSMQIDVLDVAGKLIQSNTVQGSAFSQSIDLSNQARGMYLIRISGEGIAPTVHKIMKK